MIDQGTFERLLEKGRRHGALTTEDLRAALPVDRMHADEIAMLVLRIEEEGVAVEIDDDMLARSGVPARAQPPAVPIIELPGSGPARDSLESAPAPALASPALSPAEPVKELAPHARSSWIFIAVAAAIVAALALIVLRLWS